MSRIIVTGLSALVMLFVGIQALSFREQTVSNTGLSGANETAFNMTVEVTTDATAIAGNALPRLFIVVLLALLVGVLLLSR
jgi:hypothetical protein